MESKILKHIKNPLLNREEYFLQIKSASNPSFIEVKKHLGKNEELSVVKEVRGNFGRNEFNANVFVYDSKEAMTRIEKVPRKVRKKLTEEAKKVAESQPKPEEKK